MYSSIIGGLVVALGGVLMGTSVWPMKVMRKYQFEHWWFVSMCVALVILPWMATLILCPDAIAAYHDAGTSYIFKANVFSVGWGIANVLCGLCYVRIGVALTGGILTGIGVSIGVTIPLVIKGAGLFSHAPDLTSPAGYMVLSGVAVMVVGVIFVARAGIGRDRELRSISRESTHFGGGLIMAMIAGILSVGLSFAFVYSQGPVAAAMKARGAGDMGSNLAVWAVSLIGGAAVNLAYPIYVMTRNRSWKVLGESWRDAVLSVLIGVTIIAAIVLMGRGMLLLGALGASVGFGIQQSSQMLGNQGLGFASGEWKGVFGSPRRQMYVAISLLVLAATILAYGNTLTS